jgi:CheY-like chemotaxis protein
MLGDQLNLDPMAPTVLLVEDEVVIRALLAEELRGHGLIVVDAVNADEAWAYLEAGGRADLLLSDVTMPGSMSGTDLVRRTKSRYPHLKAIIMSGNPGPSNIAELGVFLAKPYRLETAAKMALKLLEPSEDP